MLAMRRAYATIPASDLDRARQWYNDKLGLRPARQDPAGLAHETGSGTGFFLYPTPNAGQAPNTLMSFATDNIIEDVRKLMRIPTIAPTHSDGSRPPIPIDRDQCGAERDGAVGCIS
jgi:catechol 2,3-dioxygenase-like lactoylglutathione lyase family enzyme